VRGEACTNKRTSTPVTDEAQLDIKLVGRAEEHMRVPFPSKSGQRTIVNVLLFVEINAGSGKKGHATTPPSIGRGVIPVGEEEEVVNVATEGASLGVNAQAIQGPAHNLSDAVVRPLSRNAAEGIEQVHPPLIVELVTAEVEVA
jgi:hypothetical protein